MDFDKEIKNRVAWIKDALAKSGAQGLIFGASGGKDSALVGILCKMACDNTLGVIMPCGSAQNYGDDKSHALLLQEVYGIEHMVVDLTSSKAGIIDAIGLDMNKAADMNIAPRLRMTTLYTIAATRNVLVVGTSNKSEIHIGYFTKWGDGASDFNPIADLTATQVKEMLAFLNAPEVICKKAPSAGLFEGQIDEADLGFTYAELDAYLTSGIKGKNYEKIAHMHNISTHKRGLINTYKK